MHLAGSGDAVFERRGGLVVPTPYAQGPWNPEHLHGGAVAAVLARGAETAESTVPMRVVRLTVDLMRAVPMRPLRMDVRVVRGGIRIQVLDVSLYDDAVEVARASALRIRTDTEAGEEPARLHGAAARALASRPGDFPGLDERSLRLSPGFLHAVDFERGGADAAGRVVAWTRLRCPLVAGETASPLVRLAASADFTSGTASRIDYRKWLFINPDLSIHVAREPRGEWIAVEASSSVNRDGTAQSSAELHDIDGIVGHAQASMLVGRRG